MVTTVVLMNIQHNRINTVAEALSGMEGVSEVYSVGGRYDLVAIIRVPNNDVLADVVTQQMAEIEGIESTETLIAFRAFSTHDLEAMFSIGN